MTKDWKPLQEEIRRLYVSEDKQLDEVMRLVRGKYDFIASERSYRTQLKKWGFTKYSTQDFPKPNKRVRASNRTRQPPAAPSLNPDGARMFPDQAGLIGDLSAFSGPDAGRDNLFITASHVPLVGASAPQLNAFGDETQTSGLLHLGQNDQDGQGRTQLHRAALDRDLDQVRLLLNAGASVEIQDHLGNTPLHCGVTAQDIAIIELILRFGANPNAKNHVGCAPLHLATSSPNLIRALIDGGADPSIQDEKGDTPLHSALPDQPEMAFDDYSLAVSVLLESKADVNKKNKAGISPFLRLLNRPVSSVVIAETIQSFLQAGGSVFQNLPDGRTPLQIYLSQVNTNAYPGRRHVYIADRPETDILTHFLVNGASAATPMPSGESLVSVYSNNFTFRWTRNVRIGKELFKRLTPDEMNKEGDRCLLKLTDDIHNWRGTGIGELIHVLLRRGADPNYCTFHGETPLLALFGTPRGEPRIIASALSPLLDHGANPWQQNFDGVCALFEAAKRFPEERFVQMMLEADLRRQESTHVTDFESSDATRRELWDQWQQAAQSTDWDDAKRLILRRPNRPVDKTGKVIRESAYAALAKKHVHLTKDKFQDDDNAAELRRKYITGIFRDCREREVPLDTSCTDCLVDICLQ